jgi:hypothetical protein
MVMASSDLNQRNPSFINGILIGLALAIGTWGLEAIRLAGVPVPLQYPSLILGGLILIGLCGLAGWLTGRFTKTWAVILIWLTTAVVATFIISFQPYYGRTLAIWLADRRFWGLPIYPYTFGFSVAQLFAGFFIILLLGVMALLQNYRLEGIGSELGRNGRLSARAWLLLLIPLPLVMVAGLVTQNMVGDPTAKSIEVVHRAIQRGRTYEGDLFELGLREGISYGAIRGVREQMSANYNLKVAAIDPALSMTTITAHFDNNAWIDCQVLNNQLSYCYDAAPPYTTGLSNLIVGPDDAEPCGDCSAVVPQNWQNWLYKRKDLFNGPPQVTQLAQWGSYILMRAESNSGDFAVHCWFEGTRPANLTHCEEAEK